MRTLIWILPSLLCVSVNALAWPWDPPTCSELYQKAVSSMSLNEKRLYAKCQQEDRDRLAKLRQADDDAFRRAQDAVEKYKERLSIKIENKLLTQDEIHKTPFEQHRCTDLNNDSVEQGQAAGRNQWALTCLNSRIKKFKAQLEGQNETLLYRDGETEKAQRISRIRLAYERDKQILSLISGLVDFKYQDRPLYFSFGQLSDDFQISPANIEDGKTGKYIPFVAPLNPADITRCEQLPDYITVVAVCVSGCFTPDQMVLFGDGFLPVGDPDAAKQKYVVTLTADSSLDQLQFVSREMSAIVKSTHDAAEEIVIINTLAGRTIKVTKNHPLLTSDGVMHRADAINVGESLLDASGAPDLITSIGGMSYFGKVYNPATFSENSTENVIVAQGILSGNIFHQNNETQNINRTILRLNLITE